MTNTVRNYLCLTALLGLMIAGNTATSTTLPTSLLTKESCAAAGSFEAGVQGSACASKAQPGSFEALSQ